MTEKIEENTASPSGHIEHKAHEEAKPAVKKAKRRVKARKTARKTVSKAGKTAHASAHSHKPSLLTTNNVLVALLVVSLVAVGYLYAKLNSTPSGPTTTLASSGQYGTAKMEFYVMSHCPYGVQVENGIGPALEKLGNSVDFKINYIASQGADGSFSSMHGQTEVNDDIIHLCAAKHYPDKYMALILCHNNDLNTADGWKKCATDNGMDVNTISTCFAGAEGKQLMSDSIKATNAVGATGSPTMYLNGKPYNGGRDSTSFMRALCASLNNHPECANLPACSTDSECTAQPTKDGKCVNPGQKDAKCEYTDPVPMDLIVINSKDCGDSCDTSRILSVTSQLFLGSKVRNVEYNSEEGQQLVKKYGIKILPAYLFSDNITKSPSYAQVSRAMTKVGDMYQINPSAAGATYNPTLPEVPRKLDLFVMSNCPYGVMAEQNLKEVLDLFGNKINFSLRFIADKNADGTFSSLHGQKEVDEDLRQVCAIRYYPDKYYSYILCIDQDYGNAATKWNDCAEKNGLDVNTIKTCFEGTEGKQLLEENIKLGNELGVGSSPTFLINGKKQVGGAMPAESIKQALCSANAGLEGCDKTLSGASTGGAAATGGGCG